MTRVCSRCGSWSLPTGTRFAAGHLAHVGSDHGDAVETLEALQPRHIGLDRRMLVDLTQLEFAALPLSLIDFEAANLRFAIKHDAQRFDALILLTAGHRVAVALNGGLGRYLASRNGRDETIIAQSLYRSSSLTGRASEQQP